MSQFFFYFKKEFYNDCKTPLFLFDFLYLNYEMNKY